MSEYGQQPPDEPIPGYPGGTAGPGSDDLLVSLDYAGWWRNGMALAGRCWQRVLALVAVLIVVTIVFQIPLQLVTASIRPTVDTSGGAPPELGGAQIGALLLSPVAAIVSSVLTAIIGLTAVHVIADAAAGRDRSLGQQISAAMRRIGPMIGWSIVFGLLAMVGAIACLLPGVYVGLVGMLLPAVVAFDRRNAFTTCFKLFNDNFGPALGRTATIFAVTMVAGLIAACFGALTGLGSGLAAGTGAVSAGATIGSVVVGAILGGIAALITYPLTVATYGDLRGRSEPLSTPQLIADLDS